LLQQIKDHPLHFVHKVPAYEKLVREGLAKEDSSGNVVRGKEGHGCPGAQDMDANGDLSHAGLHDDAPLWLHNRVRCALREQWNAFMLRYNKITGWGKHTTISFSGKGGKQCATSAKMLCYNDAKMLYYNEPHGTKNPYGATV
jgi:hypothetical protein